MLLSSGFWRAEEALDASHIKGLPTLFVVVVNIVRAEPLRDVDRLVCLFLGCCFSHKMDHRQGLAGHATGPCVIEKGVGIRVTARVFMARGLGIPKYVKE
jgi:hypothetical protein